MSASTHPVDEILPLPALIPLGIQHVLVLYAGAVAVPLIIGRALKLPPDQVALLVNADLFACEVRVTRMDGEFVIALRLASGTGRGSPPRTKAKIND
jgi:uric acid transporter